MHDEKHEGHHHEHEHEHRADDDLRKLKILLDHWIEHNASHAQNYLDWAHKVGLIQKEAAAQELRSAAELTEQISLHFRRARELLG